MSASKRLFYSLEREGLRIQFEEFGDWSRRVKEAQKGIIYIRQAINVTRLCYNYENDLDRINIFKIEQNCLNKKDSSKETTYIIKKNKYFVFE